MNQKNGAKDVIQTHTNLRDVLTTYFSKMKFSYRKRRRGETKNREDGREKRFETLEEKIMETGEERNRR